MNEWLSASARSTQHAALKIGFLTCELTRTHGWAHYSLSLIQALHRAGVSLTVIAARNSPRVEGIEIHPLLPNTNPRENGLLPKMALQRPQVGRLLKDCDVIHCTVEPYAPLAAWVAGSRPLFITGHGSYIPMLLERRWPVGALYRRAIQPARIICVSRYTEKIIRSSLPAAKTLTINNGVEVEHFQPLARNQKNDDISVPTQHAARSTILSVGALKPRKGTLELVRAVADVRRHIPDVQCVIIGSLSQEPDYVEKVRHAIHELQLENSVQLLGHVSDQTLLHWYTSANLFVLPSMNDGWKFEGYGIVYLEASAAGLPVIGTTDNGAEDAIDDGITGLLVPQAQVAQKLPEAILRLLTNRERAARMGAAGREKAARQTWDHVARQMGELYNETAQMRAYVK